MIEWIVSAAWILIVAWCVVLVRAERRLKTERDRAGD